MAKFIIGTRISVKSNPGMRGSIKTILDPSGGHQVYEVLFDNQEISFLSEEELRNEVIATTPWDSLAQNALRNYQDFSIATTVHKVLNTTNNTVSSLKASRTIFKSYQFKPLIKFLDSDIKRILVADEVGLGKTIEAGHILLELAGRKLLNNCLVVCTKSLQAKWQTELREKFGFEFKICNTAKELLNDIQYDLNSFKKSLFAIINYEKTIDFKLLDLIQKSNYGFDLIICDEAHKLRNSETRRYKGMRTLLDFSECSIFLTATPMMTSIENLYHLLSLLDEESYSEYEIFQNYVALNKPFIKALHRLNNREPFKLIRKELEETVVRQAITIGEVVEYETEKTVSELFRQDPLYQRTIELLHKSEDNHGVRAKIQYFLSQLNSLNQIFTRSRKVEVRTSDDTITRKPFVITTPLSNEERNFYNEIFQETGDGKDAIQIITKKRQIASCIPGYFSTEEQLLRGVYDQRVEDSKFKMFKTNIIDEVILDNKQKVIVFAFFRKTLFYLKAKLDELGIKCTMIYGDIADRTEQIERFKNDDQIKVLLSSEVGSEGLDFQFCNTIVNYDLPWNPMIVEQRIGRIDRVGQKSKLIYIYTFLIKDSIEEKIYKRLLERINVFEESIGDLEEILSEDETLFEEIENLQLKLYTTHLSEAEQEKIIDQVAQALETDRINLAKVEEELTDAVVYDLHFINEINSIVNHNRYLTEIELKNFLESLFRWELTSCKLLKINDELYLLKLPQNNKNILYTFIENHLNLKQHDRDLETLYFKFKAQYWDEVQIKITFNQDFAFNNKSVEYINSYHPLIYAATKYFELKKFEINQSFRIGLDYNTICSIAPKDSNGELFLKKNNHYILVVYNIRLEKIIGSAQKANTYDYLNSILVDINGDDFVLFDDNTSNQVLGLCQLYACEPHSIIQFDDIFTSSIKQTIVPVIITKQDQLREEEYIKLRSSGSRRLKQEIQFYESQVDRKLSLLRDGKGIEQILKSQIAQLEDKIDSKNKELGNLQVNASNKIISVNHLEIV